ncbi:hypothetical protein N2152v2_002929 [Parachlorella kessleri]
MVRTRSRASFEDDFQLFHAIIAGNAATVAALCATGEAAKCGPGNLSALMLAILLDRDSVVPQLTAAGAPLDVALTLSSTAAEMHMWLAAAQLTGDAAVRHEVRTVLQYKMKPGLCALELALLLSKWEQAKLLVAAGADLQPLLTGRHCRVWCNPDTCTCAWKQVKQYAVSHYSGQGWSVAPVARLAQLALLAMQDGQPDMCLAALLAAADRGVQLSMASAVAVLEHAAAGAHVDMVMHMVQHSPGSVWGLLQGSDRFQPAVAKALFPHLAQQFVEGTLEMESQRSLPLLVERALQANQPIAAFTVLHAVAEIKQGRQRQRQMEEREQQRRQ